MSTTRTQLRRHITRIIRELEALDREVAVFEQSEPDLVGTAEVAEILGLSKGRVSQMRRAGQLPDPIVVLASGPIWDRGDIEAWNDQKH